MAVKAVITLNLCLFSVAVLGKCGSFEVNLRRFACSTLYRRCVTQCGSGTGPGLDSLMSSLALGLDSPRPDFQLTNTKRKLVVSLGT